MFASAHAHARTNTHRKLGLWVTVPVVDSLIKQRKLYYGLTHQTVPREGGSGSGGGEKRKREIKKEGRRRDRRSRRPKKSSQQNRSGREKENVWEGERDGFSYSTNLPSLQDFVFVEAGSALCYPPTDFCGRAGGFCPSPII